MGKLSREKKAQTQTRRALELLNLQTVATSEDIAEANRLADAFFDRGCIPLGKKLRAWVQNRGRRLPEDHGSHRERNAWDRQTTTSGRRRRPLGLDRYVSQHDNRFYVHKWGKRKAS